MKSLRQEIRVSLAERQAFKRAAQEMGLTVSAWMRLQLLGAAGVSVTSLARVMEEADLIRGSELPSPQAAREEFARKDGARRTKKVVEALQKPSTPPAALCAACTPLGEPSCEACRAKAKAYLDAFGDIGAADLLTLPNTAPARPVVGQGRQRGPSKELPSRYACPTCGSEFCPGCRPIEPRR